MKIEKSKIEKSTKNRYPSSNENMIFLAQIDRKSTPEFERKHDFFSPNRPKIDTRVLTKTLFFQPKSTENRLPSSNENIIFLTQIDRKSTPEF